MRCLNGCTASVALSLALACGIEQGGPPELAKPSNVILVLVDTLRADHMSLYGYERPTTPFIDELAAEGVVFDRARSQAGCTYPSVNSMLTSRYPFDFYARGPGDMGIPEEYPSLAEILEERGFETVAISASPIVRVTPSSHNPTGGFGRGFDVFDEQCLWKPAECVNEKALELLATVREPFFLYLHYMDPHDRYRPPATHERRFAGAYDGLDFIADGNPNPISDMLYDDGPTIDYTDRDIQHLVDLYDEEILYFDGELRALVAALRQSGVLERSLLVLTSDHGEEFLEHGHVKHCRGVWDTLTRVPLLLRTPGSPARMRISTPVQLVDIMPTVLDILRIEAPALAVEGGSLRALMGGPTPTRRHAFSDQVEYRSSDDGRFHLIFNGLEGTYALYDMLKDPLEQNDLVRSHALEAQRLTNVLENWLKETGQWEHFDLALVAAEAQQEQLRALGYLE